MPPPRSRPRASQEKRILILHHDQEHAAPGNVGDRESRPEWVPLDRIVVDDPTPLDPSVVAGLVASYRRCGILSALLLDHAFRLVCGRHRLAAMREAGLGHALCVVRRMGAEEAAHARLCENLCRQPGTVLARAGWVVAWEDALASIDGRRRGGRANPATVTGQRTTEQLAGELGVSGRTYQRLVRIGRGLSPAVCDALRGTPLAGSTTKLLALADTPPDRQRLLADQFLREVEEAESRCVLDAVAGGADGEGCQAAIVTADRTPEPPASPPGERTSLSSILYPLVEEGGGGESPAAAGSLSEATLAGKGGTDASHEPASCPANRPGAGGRGGQTRDRTSEPPRPRELTPPYVEGRITIRPDGTAVVTADALRQVSELDADQRLRIYRGWTPEIKDSLSGGIPCLLLPEFDVRWSGDRN